jgi:RNA polymerase sigma factor (sigma-70 family)
MPVFRNDPELLAAFREGRRDALECVYRTYAPSVGRLVRALARAHARGGELARVNAVTDIFQEVFMRAFSPTSRQAYDGHRDFGPYLMAVARHCFIDALRAQGHEVPRSPHELSRDMDGPSEEPGDGLDPKILRVLTAYVAALPEDVAGVYEQRFVLGHSQDQTAIALAISRSSVRTIEGHLRRGLKRALVRSGVSLGELGRGEDAPATTCRPNMPSAPRPSAALPDDSCRPLDR